MWPSSLRLQLLGERMGLMITPSELGLSSHFSSFRTFADGVSQFDLASKIAYSPYRFRGLCAQAGTGKSLVNLTSSQILSPSRCLYLTVNKSLQSQLLSDCEDSSIKMFNLTGHSSYPCMRGQDSECTEGANCSYWQDVKRSLTYPYICTNVHNWVSIAKVGDGDRFGKFDYIIIDEAHNLESLLCDLLTLKFYEQTIDELLDLQIPESLDLQEWIDWSTIARGYCEREFDRSQALDDGRISTTTKRLTRLLSDLETLSNVQRDWIVKPLDRERGVSITPVFASDYAETFLFRSVSEITLCSATLTSKDFEYLGIPTSEYELLDVDTGFDPNRAPFYYWPTQPIDYSISEGQLIQVVRRMGQIISSRQSIGWKGLTHSISYKWAKRVADLSRDISGPEILTHQPHNSRQIIDAWMEDSSPSHIASPILGEGIDLKGDLCRYQIIFKVPMQDSRDPLIAARKKRDKKYTLYLAGKDILQMKGRVQREECDFGETFLLDKYWERYMRKAIPWPKHFTRTWKDIDRPPEPIRF
jgi:ATP-dependent DNA helicase DinG